MIVCLLFWTAPGAAALYEFKLEGVVIRSFLADVHVGDTAAIKFLVDDVDLEASPNVGWYATAGPSAITFPKTTLIAGESGHLQVKLSNSNSELIQYINIGGDYSINIPFQFPDGTITSDALPLSLPLPLATNNSFQIFPILTDVVYGRVTSYSGALVPEPEFMSALVATLLMLGRVPRRNGKVRRGAGQEPSEVNI